MAFPKGDTRHFPIGWEKSYRMLVWSPDSSRIVCYEPYVDEVPLVFVDLATGETRNVAVRFARKVVWSPDSTRVACNTDSELLTISADDGRIQEVVSDDNIKDVSWATGSFYRGLRPPQEMTPGPKGQSEPPSSVPTNIRAGVLR